MHFNLLLKAKLAFFLFDPSLSENSVVCVHLGELHVEFVETMRVAIRLNGKGVACYHVGKTE